EKKARIQVSIEADKSLQLERRIGFPNGDIGRVTLTYEGLHRYCFTCHHISHDENTCPQLTPAERELKRKQRAESHATNDQSKIPFHDTQGYLPRNSLKRPRSPLYGRHHSPSSTSKNSGLDGEEKRRKYSPSSYSTREARATSHQTRYHSSVSRHENRQSHHGKEVWSRLEIPIRRHEERNGECQHSRNVPHYVASRSRNTPTSRRHPRRNNEVARNKASTNWVPRKTPQGHTERSQATYDSQKTISDNRESLESGEVVPNRGTEAIIEETEAKRTRRLKGKAIVTDSPTSNAKETHPSLMARRSKNLTITEQPLDAPPLLTRREQKYDPPIMEQGDKFMELGAGLDQDLGVQLTELELAEVDNLVLETERLEMEDNMIDIENDDLLGDSPDFDAEKIEAISQLSPANAAITKMATLSQHLPIDKVTGHQRRKRF
ncbi:hypothetical protein HID58_042577, partial [Brassica napus]